MRRAAILSGRTQSSEFPQSILAIRMPSLAAAPRSAGATRFWLSSVANTRTIRKPGLKVGQASQMADFMRQLGSRTPSFEDVRQRKARRRVLENEGKLSRSDMQKVLRSLAARRGGIGEVLRCGTAVKIAVVGASEWVEGKGAPRFAWSNLVASGLGTGG